MVEPGAILMTTHLAATLESSTARDFVVMASYHEEEDFDEQATS